MKKTILFSNIVGNIYNPKDCKMAKFNEYMKMLLPKCITQGSNLVFVNAPGFANDKMYMEFILNCFLDCGIKFSDAIELNSNTTQDKWDNFDKQNRVYFLMGGNPITQREIIKKFNLEQELKNTESLVIGFCAGAINLSSHSIITSDRDFEKPFCYKGIGRVNITIEPHYFEDDSPFTKNRIDELLNFSYKLESPIYAIYDESCIVVENDVVIEYGKIKMFDMR